MNMRIINLVQTCLLFLLLSSDAWGFSIYEASNSIILEGSIEEGDTKKLVQFLKKRNGPPDLIEVSSAGGDVVEAMKLGHLVRDTLLSVGVKEHCYSACFFILTSSVNRFLPNYGIYFDDNGLRIGIHRPYFDKKYFARLSMLEAEVEYKKLQQVARQFLIEMDVPTILIEKMFSIPSDDMYLLSPQEIKGISGKTPAFDEWLKSKCAYLTSEEKKDFLISNVIMKKWKKAGECERTAVTEQTKARFKKYFDDVGRP